MEHYDTEAKDICFEPSRLDAHLKKYSTMYTYLVFAGLLLTVIVLEKC